MPEDQSLDVSPHKIISGVTSVQSKICLLTRLQQQMVPILLRHHAKGE